MTCRLATIALAALLLPLAPAAATTIGVAMPKFDDAFLAILRNGMQRHADGLGGVTLRIEDAKNDSDRQIETVKGFVADGVDAIVVAPVDGDAGPVLSKIAADAGIPLVYANVEPVNIDELPDGQAFVASDERDSGTLQAREICRRLGGKGRVVVMMGEMFHYAARRRTQDVADVLAGEDCKGVVMVERQSANWSRVEGETLMREWLAAGIAFDAVIANNDEMALGAIRAMTSAGIAMDGVIVAGIDATADAMAAMDAGELDVTVFQNAAGQGAGAVDAAVALAAGKAVETRTYVPFELVVPETMAAYRTRN